MGEWSGPVIVPDVEQTHMLNIINETIASSLRSDETSTPGQSLSSQYANVFVPEFLVSSEQEADLASTSANVTSGHIGVFPDVLAKLAHEGSAESANLAVGFALRVEVGSTLASSHRETSQGILEGLLESKELENGEVDSGMQTEAALVRAQGGVVLQIGGQSDVGWTNLTRARLLAHGSRCSLAFGPGRPPKRHGIG